MKKQLREEITQVKEWLQQDLDVESQSLFRVVKLYAIPLLEKLEKND